MEIAAVVFEHNFDKAMLEQIDSLRTIQLNQAESMLSDLRHTMQELYTRGLVEDDVDAEELRRELNERIAMLRERIKHPDVVYADELSLYVDLLDTCPDDTDDVDHDD